MALLRCTPYCLAMAAANVVHYSSLWEAKEAATRRVKVRQELLHTSEHEPLTFHLMTSPEMRKARYKIKLLRYTITLLHVLLFHSQIEELDIHNYALGWGSLEAVLIGLLAGLFTIYQNENRDLQMRTPWKPSRDFASKKLGIGWDCLRMAGGCLAVPVEEELFYHSWLYRVLVKLFCCCYNSFDQVPIGRWHWMLCLATNGFFALLNGMEWRSCLVRGLLFQWVAASREIFLDGLLAHAICNLTVSSWVLLSGQRQFW